MIFCLSWKWGGKCLGKDKNQNNQPSDSLDLYVAKLAFIGASIATLGDGLSAVAAGIALEALEKKEQSNNKSPQNQNGQSKQLEKMQKQIDDLINELNQVKKMFRWWFTSKFFLSMLRLS